MTALVLAVVVLAGIASPAAAQAQARPAPDPVASLLTRLEQTLREGVPGRYLDLLLPSADRSAAGSFAASVVAPGVTRAVVRERDRGPLTGTLPGDGYSLLVEVFLESGPRARLATWRLDVRRRASDADWGIVFQDSLTTLSGLFKLALNPKRQVAAKDLVVSAEDMTLSFSEATMFVAETDVGPTAAVVVGRGEIVFSPAPPAERSQLRVLTGSETLQSTVEVAFVRVSPASFDTRVKAAEIVDRPAVDPRDFKRAEEIFRQEVGKSFCLELRDLSDETWSLLPTPEDFLAEIRTRRFDTLTYARSSNEIEDISVFDRKSQRNLSVYSSRAHLARYSRFYNEDDHTDVLVHAYDLDVRYSPGSQQLEGHARLTMETTAPSMNSFTLKLADSLDVKGIVARELGRLLTVRVRNQNSVVVNLPTTLLKGFRLNLEVLYSGRLEPQPIDRESIDLQPPRGQEVEEFEIPLEESYLFSNRSFWYPQPAVLGYASAQIRVTLDEPWAAVASGELVSATLAPGPVERGVRPREFTFSVTRPARYLALLIGRFVEVRREKINVHDADVDLRVFSNPRQRGRGKDLVKTVTSVMKFYSSLVGDFPYPAMNVCAVERRLPGGHSPGYMAVLAIQGPTSQLRWENDPGALPFAEFFVAHEVAHQWWGQAVGWKNYHEQWISEGFSQYFAALYAERSRGRATFDAIIRRMQGWALGESDQGPIFLGYRIGHAKGDPRLFRAVVYNKGAMVLHMLRRLVGDEAFFGGLRQFYETWRFKKAGTDDFRKAIEQQSGMGLGRFFEQWVLGEGVPQVTFSWNVEQRGGASEAVVRLEQEGTVYDVPVTVTVEYDDGSVVNSTVKLTLKSAEARIPLTRRVRRVDVNRDRAAVGVFRAAGAQ